MKDLKENRLRWGHYFMRHGDDFDEFWKELLNQKDRNVLFILGLGFDPRMCIGSKKIISAGGSGSRDCMLIEFDEGVNSPSKAYSEFVNSNRQILQNTFTGKGNITPVSIALWSTDNRRIGSRKASELIDKSCVEKYTDIIVDISALPRGIYYPLLAKLLYILDIEGVALSGVNLHVVIAENVKLDETIQEEGIDEKATYLHGFSSDLEREATAGIPVIWIPVLGEGKIAQLERIYEHIKPDEICPVLPSPSRNPRRADNLILEYRELFLDKLRVEPKNIIYASERNPFEAYRQIYYAIIRYHNALNTLGGCKVVVSAVSSKLLSIGALLASYEAKRSKYMIGISHVESHGYKIIGSPNMNNSSDLFTLWLAGECYHD